MHSQESQKKELLRKYIDRTISDAERHELEKLALDDPFLFEALEGYSVGGTDNSKTILNKNVNALKIQKPKSKAFRITQLASIAAGLLFVAVMGFVIKQNIDNREANTIKLVEQTEEEFENDTNDFSQVFEEDQQSSLKLDNAESLVQEEKDLSEEPKDETIIAQEKVVPISKDTLDKGKKLAEKENAPVYEKENLELMADADEEQEKNSRENAKPETTERALADSYVKREYSMHQNYKKGGREVPEEMKKSKTKREDESSEIVEYKTISRRALTKKSYDIPESAPVQKESSVESRKIVGQIVDADGQALIGAAVTVPGTKIGTTTNLDGDFALEIPDSTQQIQTQYTGFTPQMVMLGEPDSYQIQLEEGALLDEIVVTTTNGNTGRNIAEPEMGYEQFEDYLKENVVAEDCSETRILVFEIDPTGGIKNIRELNGKKDDCTNEAIRLLQNSGKWRSIPPKRSVTTQYIFDFRR